MLQRSRMHDTVCVRTRSVVGSWTDHITTSRPLGSWRNVLVKVLLVGGLTYVYVRPIRFSSYFTFPVYTPEN